MLKAMELISTDAKNKITLHFTGVDKEKFGSFCDTFDRCSKSNVAHQISRLGIQ